MDLPNTITEAVATLNASPRFAGNAIAIAARINRHTIPVAGDPETVGRPDAIVMQEILAKEAVIDAALALGTPFQDRDQVWNALLNLSGTGFIARARQLVEAAPNDGERLRRVEAAATIQALFLAAKEAEAAGAKSYRHPFFAKASETVTRTTQRLWIDEHNNGQRVTPEQVAEVMSGG